MLAALQRTNNAVKRRTVEVKGTEGDLGEVTGLHTGLQDMNVEGDGPAAAAVMDDASSLLVSQVNPRHFNDQRVIAELARRGHHLPTSSAAQRKTCLVGLLSAPVAPLAASSGDASLICVTGLVVPLRA
jgi:hypothetical protein